MELLEIIKDELSTPITDIDFIIELLEISKTNSKTLDKLITKVERKLINAFTVEEKVKVPSEVPTEVPSEEVINVVEDRIPLGIVVNNMVKDHIDSQIQDYNLTNKKVVTDVVTTSTNIELFDIKISLEKQLVLLTIAWCKRPIPTSYVCKQAQRLSFYFNLDKDKRWNQIDKWNKCKMRTDLVSALHLLKKQDYLSVESDSEKPTNKLYYLNGSGLELARRISETVGFDPFNTPL
jgi:hypothetical protein